MARRFLNEFDSGQHSKYLLYYHLVVVTKYRRPFIDDRLRPIIVNNFKFVGKYYGVNLVEVGGESDHMHFLFSCRPDTDLPKFICSFKSRSSRIIRQCFDDIVTRMGEYKGFWSPSYCLLTTGGAPIDIIRKYIERQGKHDGKSTRQHQL